MKNLVILSFLCFLEITDVLAQKTIPRQVSYSKSDFNRFLGSWATNVDGKTLRLVFKNEDVVSGDSTQSLIQGYYTFGSANEKQAERDSLPFKSIIQGTLSAENNFSNAKKLQFTIIDLERNDRHLQGTLSLDPMNIRRASLFIRKSENNNNNTTTDDSISIPVDVLLYKE